MRMRVALVGAGYIADLHAKALRDLSRSQALDLIAVVDTSAARAASFAARYGVVACTSLSELVELGVQAVHILVPPEHHKAVALEALANGFHVLCEKPLVDSSADAHELFRAAKQVDRRLAVSHNFLFGNAYGELRKAVVEHRFGRIEHIGFTWYAGLAQLKLGPFGTWLTGDSSNVFHETGAHLVSMAFDLLGPSAASLELVSSAASDPISLPDGGLVWRRWQILARSGFTSVSFDISAREGANEKCLRLRAAAGNATCYFDRDQLQTVSSYSLNPLIDDFRHGLNTAASLLGQTIKQAARQTLATFRGGARNNAYGASFVLTSKAFYESLSASKADADWRLSPQLALATVAFCDAVVSANRQAKAKDTDARRASAQTRLKPTGLTARVVVTGATGFIGKELTKQLLDSGYSVLALTRDLRSARLILDGRADVVAGSLTDRNFLVSILTKGDTVIHLARGGGKRWEDYMVSDVEPTKVLGEVCAQIGVARFIYTGTIDSYDSARFGHVIDEQTPLDAGIASRNHYARAKAHGEQILRDLAKVECLPLVIARPGIVVGAGASPAHWGVGMFRSLTEVDYWGKGDNPLPFVLVEDVATALVKCVERSRIIDSDLLLIGSPEFTGQEYVKAFEEAYQSRINANERSIFAWWIADFFKEALKHVIRHPNRKKASYHDWACRRHASRYNSKKTQSLLQWKPCDSREVFVARGINAAVEQLVR